MSYGNDKPTPPMTDAERAARIDELDRVARWISTKDEVCDRIDEANPELPIEDCQRIAREIIVLVRDRT